MTTTTPPRVLPWPAGRPWDSYAALHESSGPVWFDAGLDSWLVTGYREASEVLRATGWSSDPSLARSFAAAASSTGVEATALGQLLIFTDPPRHTRVRRALQPPFGPKPVEAWRHRVRSIAEAALAGIDRDDDVDLMDRLARPVPLAVMGELFDLPPDVVGLLAEESQALVRLLDLEATPADVAAAAGAFTGLLLALLPLAAARRSRPGPDVLSWIAADESLALEEVVFAALLLGIAGHETTANLVGTTLAAGPCPRWPSGGWASETTRLHAPVQAVLRVATAPCRVGQAEIDAGDQVIVAIAAANRDPAVFHVPEVHQGRGGPEPLSFGLGRHYCLGARLAILELEEIVGAIARQGSVELGPIEWNDSRTICGPASMPARIVPPAPRDAIAR